MNYKKPLAFAFILSFSLVNAGQAQSDESFDEDPLTVIDDLMETLESIEQLEDVEEFDSGMDSGALDGESEGALDESLTNDLDASVNAEGTAGAETSESTDTQNATTTEPVLEPKSVGNRLAPKEIPEGKENHLLYKIPGAIDYKGMTFLRIDSPRFFNQFQKCDTTDADRTQNALARLKISQGAPLECREAMKYQFMPYKTFRASR